MRSDIYVRSCGIFFTIVSWYWVYYELDIRAWELYLRAWELDIRAWELDFFYYCELVLGVL